MFKSWSAALVGLALLIVSAAAATLDPAHAGPREDCRNGIRDIERAARDTILASRSARAVDRLLKEARAAQSASDIRLCVKRVNEAKLRLGMR